MINTHPAPAAVTIPIERQIIKAKRWKPSVWIWVPWIWLLFAATRQPGRWLLWNKPVNFSADDVASSPIDRVLFSALMVVGLYVLSRRINQMRKILQRNKCLVLFFVYLGSTILWSNFPAISFVRYFRTVGVLEMVLVVLTEQYPSEAVRVLLRRLYVVHITLSAITIKYVRSIGVFYDWSGQEQSWIGLSTDKNSLGQVAMFSGVFWLWQICQYLRKGKRKGRLKALTLNGALLLVTLWILRGSKSVHSSTAIIGFIVCAVVVLGLQLIRKRTADAKRFIMGVTVAVMLLGPVLYWAVRVFGAAPAADVLHATGRNMTFTDRNLIWEDVLNIAKRQPVLGVGVGALWVGRIGYELYPMPNWSAKTPEWRPEEAHNGYIDTYAQTGLIGLALLILVIAKAIDGALNDLQRNFDSGALRLVLLLGVLLCNVSESSFLLGTSDLWFIFLLLAINLPASAISLPSKQVKWDDSLA